MKGKDTLRITVFFWTLSIVRYSKKLESTMFGKMDLFPSSAEREDTYPVGSLTEG
jgi:hypothetical protein